jgi:hypothetical protein
MYFEATLHPTSTLGQIWTAQKNDATGRYDANASPVPELETADDTAPTWISPDGCRLYFEHGNDVFVAARGR